MQPMALLAQITGSFEDEASLEAATGRLLGAVGSLLAADRLKGAEVARLAVARLTAGGLAGTARRRSFARYMDAFADALGPQVCTPEAVRVLLESSARVTAKEESVVATEVLLGVLGSQQHAAAARPIWDQVWAEFHSNQGTAVGLESLFKLALARFPGIMYPMMCEKLHDKSLRLRTLQLLCAAVTDESTTMELFDEEEDREQGAPDDAFRAALAG